MNMCGVAPGVAAVCVSAWNGSAASERSAAVSGHRGRSPDVGSYGDEQKVIYIYNLMADGCYSRIRSADIKGRGGVVMSHWYALRSKPRKEDLLWQHARAQGFEVFYPRIPVKPANPRARTIVPYFPGYLFVRADLTEVGVSVFQWMPNALGLVSFDGEPATVEDDLVSAVRQRARAIAEAGGELFQGLTRGDKVVIHAGPFVGFEAIFDGHASGADRVRVLLDLLNGRQVAMELGAGQIARRSA